MREIGFTAAVLAASLLLTGAVVFRGHDRSVLVPAPEATVENFARQLAARRFDLARKHLSSAASQSETAHTLAARFAGLARAGTINEVVAEPKWMREDSAAARAMIAGDADHVSFDVGLVRESGLWKIAHLPDLVR
jgi:hypothetical protein